MQVGESALIDHLEGVGGGRTKHISGPWLREEGHPKDRQTHVRQTDKTKGRERGVDREKRSRQMPGERHKQGFGPGTIQSSVERQPL